jgi:hypothetical protein
MLPASHPKPRSPVMFASPIVTPRDFRLLGLTSGECQPDEIRGAIVRSSKRAVETRDPMDLDRRLSRIVTAGYRLLDPRRRIRVYQRVQLGFPLDRDEWEIPNFPNGAPFGIHADELGPALPPEPEQSALEQARAIVRLIQAQDSPKPKSIWPSTRSRPKWFGI